MKTLSKDKVKTIREDLKSLNEKERRQYLFKIAMDLGPGGMSHVSRRFNISITTLKKAKIEIDKGDYYIQGDKIRSTKEKSFLSEQTINESLEKIKFMKEKERRQYLYQIYLTISNKFGALGYICKTFHVSKETLYRAKAEFENGDIWQVGQRVRKIGAGRPKKKHENYIVNFSKSATKRTANIVYFCSYHKRLNVNSIYIRYHLLIQSLLHMKSYCICR